MHLLNTYIPVKKARARDFELADYEADPSPGKGLRLFLEIMRRVQRPDIFTVCLFLSMATAPFHAAHFSFPRRFRASSPRYLLRLPVCSLFDLSTHRRVSPSRFP